MIRRPLAGGRRIGGAAAVVAVLALCPSALGVVPAGAHLGGHALDPVTVRTGAGRLLFRDPAPPRAVNSGITARAAARGAPYPLAQTFRLHSLPGSQHTIYLDFDGGLVTGTAWNATDIGLPARTYPGWVLDGTALHGNLERRDIQGIWQRVAEDFAPFDVDVTTEQPDQSAIDRSGPDDPSYGTRVMVSSSRAAMRYACPVACSGSAWFDVFDATQAHDYSQPAWVFPRVLGDDVTWIADTISHEVGHNFGLLHDGTGRQEYYGGHRAWAPIMGAGFDRPIVQWSRGGYAGANNQQDDLAVIAANGAPLRADEAGDTVDGAGPLPVGPAYVTTDADRDVYALGRCRGAVTVRARVAPVGADLDARLTLLRADGSVVSVANPRSRKVDDDRASGLSASISTTLPPGAYFARVEGVGNGGALRGYDGYGSLGGYTVHQAGCSG